MPVRKKDVGLCSYAFRYAVGTANFHPPRPMGPVELIREAARLGYGRVLFFDNIGSENFDQALCANLARELADRDMTACFGVRNLSGETFARHLPLAAALGADCLRLAVTLRESPEATVAWAEKIFAENLKRIEDQNLCIGVENHFSLAPEYVERLVESLDHPRIGYVYDSTNSICFVEKPEETLRRMRKRLYAAHFKDFVFQKLEAGYLMNGVALGEGVSDIPGLIREALSYNPEAKIELELTMLRPEGLDAEGVVAWEADGIAKSSAHLFRILGEI